MSHHICLSVLAVAAFTLAGCTATGDTAGGGTAAHTHGGQPAPGGGMMRGGMAGGGMMGGMMKGRMAVASLTPTQGNNVRGLVMFHEMDGHLMVHAKVSGLKPNGEHGFHVHETGSCASTDGSSAGGHFNPDGKPHGPQDAAHHVGDLPSLKADANGVVDQKMMVMGPTVAAGAMSVVGRSVIVHALPDDFVTQPTGNSGARLGCGVIAAH
jgi:superoxide dismutase, Cu-Zn family